MFPGAQKGYFHLAAGSPVKFHELIVDIFSLRVPDIFIVDAVTGMERNCPSSPDRRDIGRVPASDNAAAPASCIICSCRQDICPEKAMILRKVFAVQGAS